MAQCDEDDYEDPLAEVPPAGNEFVAALASVLRHLASRTACNALESVTSFHSARVPPLSVQDYLARIAKYYQCSNECFVLCLVYLDRIVKFQPDFTICDLNIHRIVATSAMLSVKFFDDVYYSNAYYSKVGGIRLKEANNLEAQFLALISWRLYVAPEEYEQYRLQVFSAVQGMNPCHNLELPAMPSPATETTEAETEEHEEERS